MSRSVTWIPLALLALPVPLIAQASGSYTLSGDRVAVYNLAGSVEVVRGSGTSVEVAVDPRGPDAGQLTVETGPIRGAETLRILYPADRIVYDREDRGRGSRSEVRVREDGTFFGDEGQRGDRVTIRSSGDGLEAHADLTISVPPGQRVSVLLAVGDVSVTNIDGDLMVDVGSAPVEAHGVRGSLSIDTGSGEVGVSDVEGDLSVDTGSGQVDVRNVQGSRVGVDTGSGGVTGSRIVADAVNVDTGSGSIDLGGVTAPSIQLDTGSGSVEVELMSDVDDLVVDTGSGSVTVFFSEDLGARLDLESSSGGIEFEVPITVSRVDRHSLQGEIGDGNGRIRIDTGSGSIRFVRR